LYVQIDIFIVNNLNIHTSMKLLLQFVWKLRFAAEFIILALQTLRIFFADKYRCSLLEGSFPYQNQYSEKFWYFFQIFPSACSNYQVCGQISSKTFNLQGWNLQHCPQSAQSLGKNIKNIIYSINMYNKILTYILRSIFLKIPHLELLRWRKTPRDTNGKGV
jgi:hypothetical protein